MVQAGSFREDLYCRLKVFVIRTPPLREHPEDIVPLAEHFVSRMNTELKRNVKRIPVEYIEVLKAYGWPGNVRELGNVLGRAMILSRGEVLELDECGLGPAEAARPQASASEDGEIKSLSMMEKELILKTLRHTRVNYGETCKILGITRPTLPRKIKDYALKECLGEEKD
jgi:DNA-binding NtrC family response regulator